MKTYCIYAKADPDGEAYWVQAISSADARYAVAKAVEAAAEAEDPAKFACMLDDAKSPPPGMIYRRLFGPLAIRS